MSMKRLAKCTLLLAILLVSNVFAAKNYYWNYGVQWPATDKDMIYGRCPLYLEAIRKLIFLIDSPAAGYYKDDLPSVIRVNGQWQRNLVDGELAGYLPVYDPNGYVMSATSTGVASLIYYDANSLPYIDGETAVNREASFVNLYGTNYRFSAGTVGPVHRKGSVRLWCDGCIYIDTISTVRFPASVGVTRWMSTTPPQAGGWFAQNEPTGWGKTPSRNAYHQYDFNSYRKIYGGDIEGSGLDDVIQDWGFEANKYYPKSFNPYQRMRPLYRVPEAYLDGGELLHYVADKTVPVLNKYYEYNNNLWKCLAAETEDVPAETSDDWQYINLWTTAKPIDFKFLLQSIQLKMNDFYQYNIQGAVYSSQGQINEHPYWANTQYYRTTDKPVGQGGDLYPEDIKMAECIMAYIERLFDDERFYAQVDSEFKQNYHTLVGGYYGGVEYDSYDDAVAAGKADMIVPITHRAWGCNGSGFEWALKQTGDYVWYFDTSKPYFFDTATWDWTGINGGSSEETEAIHAELTAAVSKFIGNIRGTWRRTWKYSYGFPQNIKHVQPSTYNPPKKGLFAFGESEFAADPQAALTNWYSQAYADGDTYDFTTWKGTSYTLSGSTEAANDATTSALYEPDFTVWSGGQKVEKWSIDRMTKIVNHIWDVLNVPLGYRSTCGGISTAGNYVEFNTTAVGEFLDLTAAGVNAKYNELKANHKTITYTAAAPGFSTYISYTGSVPNSGNSGLWGFYGITRVTLSEVPDEIPPHAVLRIPTKREYIFPFDLVADKNNLVPGSVLFLSGSKFQFRAGVPVDPAADDWLDDISQNWDEMKTVYYDLFSISAQKLQNGDLQCYMTSAESISESIVYLTNEYGYLYGKVGGVSGDWMLNDNNEFLITYDWSAVPASVWYNDGNWPVLVATFDLPLAPPYPNPISWIGKPELDLTRTAAYYSGELPTYEAAVSGYVCNATSNPAGRDVKYIFRLKTMYNIGESELEEWDKETAYTADDEVYWNGYSYTALTDNANKQPNLYTADWEKGDMDGGWNRFVDSDVVDDYEYYHDTVSDEYFIKLADDEEQSEVNYELPLTTNTDLLQNFIWYYNLCNWQVYGKTYDDGGTGTQLEYNGGKQILWGIETLKVDYSTGLDMGCLVSFERQLDPNDVPLDVYDVNYSWNWLGKDGETLVDPNDNPVLTDDPDLITLCEIHEYDPETKVWNDWTKTAVFKSSNGKSLPTTITPETEADWLNVMVRAEVTLSSPPATGDNDIEHIFYTGWTALLPAGGLNF